MGRTVAVTFVAIVAALEVRGSRKGEGPAAIRRRALFLPEYEREAGNRIFARNGAAAIHQTGDSAAGDGIPCADDFPGEVAEWLKAAPC
jgi:hypothetical protein